MRRRLTAPNARLIVSARRPISSAPPQFLLPIPMSTAESGRMMAAENVFDSRARQPCSSRVPPPPSSTPFFSIPNTCTPGPRLPTGRAPLVSGRPTCRLISGILSGPRTMAVASATDAESEQTRRRMAMISCDSHLEPKNPSVCQAACCQGQSAAPRETCSSAMEPSHRAADAR